MNDSSQFTENKYIELLKLAKSKYDFCFFPECKNIRKGILWRHDIDFSVQRALALAKIEAEQNVKSTYFVLLHGAFYNPFERVIVDKLREIVSYGHEIGLHFDPSFYEFSESENERMETWVYKEKCILEDIVESRISAFSFHNPDANGGSWHRVEIEEIAGMTSAYSPYIREHFTYCSDSNGYWRFDSLLDVLNVEPDCLHVTTHPCWWTPEILSPRKRIIRCLEGRVKNTLADYDDLLIQSGRTNCF